MLNQLEIDDDKIDNLSSKSLSSTLSNINVDN